jgi:hypothetical protein
MQWNWLAEVGADAMGFDSAAVSSTRNTTCCLWMTMWMAMMRTTRANPAASATIRRSVRARCRSSHSGSVGTVFSHVTLSVPDSLCVACGSRTQPEAQDGARPWTPCTFLVRWIAATLTTAAQR